MYLLVVLRKSFIFFAMLRLMSEIKAVVLDIDGTLSPEISWLALTRDLGASPDEHIAIYTAYKNGETQYSDSKQSLLNLWQGTCNANKPYFQSLFDGWPLVDGAKEIVAQLKEKYKVCLITGSMDLYAETVAHKLGVTDWFANTSLHWDDDGNLIDMDYELNQAQRKLNQFLGYCSTNNLLPTECIVVGDSDNDIELFRVSGKGIAVGTDIPAELATVAWKSIDSFNELNI